MVKVVILSFFTIIQRVVICQEFIFKTMDNHEGRISALEASKNNCDCNDLKMRYDQLKLEMGQILNTVNLLKSGLKQSVPANVQHSTKPSSETSVSVSFGQSAETTMTNGFQRIKVYSDVSTQPSVSTSSPSTYGMTNAYTKDATTGLSGTDPTTELSGTYATTELPGKDATTPTAFQNDCVSVLSNDNKRNGLYNITLQNGKKIKVYCDLENDGGGWIVIQRREDGKQDFNQNWKQYKNGFGNPLHEFWIGNENLHVLTNGKTVDLHIKLMSWDGVNHTAVYSGFRIRSEQSKYRLNVQQFLSGDAGDSFTYSSSYMLRHNNMAFSTQDRDNDKSFQHCGRLLQSGWWFNACYSSNLNGRYQQNGPYGSKALGESYGQPTMEGTGIEWYPLKHKQYSMKFVEMKIRAR